MVSDLRRMHIGRICKEWRSAVLRHPERSEGSSAEYVILNQEIFATLRMMSVEQKYYFWSLAF